jgi:hypothetical protein
MERCRPPEQLSVGRGRTSGPNAAMYLQTLGGLYIMIRGLDNITASAPNRD